MSPFDSAQLTPNERVARDAVDCLDRGGLVYCASEQAILAATIAYAEASGELADAKGLAAALVAAHAPMLGLDRSVCLRDSPGLFWWLPWNWERTDVGWTRELRVRLTCYDCGRRFWRWRRYVCRRCM